MLGLSTGILISRALGPEGRGEYGVVTNCVLVLVMLAAAGMPSALTQARAKAGRGIGDLYAASFVIGITTAVIGLGIGAAFFFTGGDRILRVARATDLLWAVVATPPILVLNHWAVVAFLEDRFKEYGLATISGGVILLVVVAIFITSRNLSPTVAIGCWSVSATVPFLLMVRSRRLRIRAGLRTVIVGLVRFSLRANLMTLALILVWRVDVVIVNWLRGLREVGLYAVAVALAEILVQGTLSLRTALTPLQGSADNRRDLVTRICAVNRVMLVGLTFLAVLVAVASGPFVGLAYGPAFAAAAPAVAWLLPGVVVLLLQGPLIDYLVTEGRVRDVTVVTCVALAVNVAIDVVFLPHNSFVVAAISSTVAYGFSFVLCAVLFTRLAGVGARELLLIRSSDLVALRAAAAALVGR